MSTNNPLAVLSKDERVRLCREVMERLSDLVEGAAPQELCERVDELLGDRQPYLAYCATLRATIQLTRECRERFPPEGFPDEEDLRRCVESVRRRLS